MKKCGFLIIGLFLVSILVISILYTNEEHKYYNDGLLYINEIMASNKYTIEDNYGSHSDYIEIYNDYDEDINLEGYYLSDKDDWNERWKFPKVTIKAKSYLLVYASGKDECKEDVCHTNFKLSNKGGVLSLTSKDGKILSKIKYDETESDTSYGYNGKKYVYYYTGTPAQKNNSDESQTPIIRGNSNIKIRITEYTNNNLSIISDEDNENVSIVELYNYSDKDIKMDGFFLSNSNNKLNKYSFKNTTIKAGEYLLVYLSGKDKNDSQIHTNFTLNTSDSVLVLSSNKGEIIDKIKIEPLAENMLSFLKDDKWLYTYTSTLGKKNDASGSISILNESNQEKALMITEVSSTAIEIKNISEKDINLKDYKLSGNGSPMNFPDVTIKSNGYITIYESDNYSYTKGVIYSGFKISSTQEKIVLSNSNNEVIDTFTTGKLNNNISYGINNEGKRVIYTNKTIGYVNINSYFLGYTDTIKFSIEGGYVKEGQEVILSTTDGSNIYYTLDGSVPTTSSTKYTNPIKINKTTTIRAISVKENYLQSDIISRTYFTGRTHDMAIVSISTDNSNLYGRNGMFTNYRRDMEKEISFEFYEPDGTFGTMFNAGASLVGQDSREFPQKSISIHLRNQYGQNEVTYPFFTDHDVINFSSFTLRNSGEDVTFLKFKDAYLVEVLKGQMDLDFQYYRPVVVYINGEYYGIYNIREKINEAYVANNHGVDEDNVDLIKGNNDVRAGSMDNYNKLINYVKTHDMRNQEYYNYVKTQVDIQELINYWVVQTYYGNTDTGNIRFWRERTDEGKWRWVLFDQDWAMWPTMYTQVDLSYPMEPYGHGIGNCFSTSLTYNLYKNAEFRDLYLQTFAKHMKTTFKPDRMLKIFNEVKSKYETEMPYHLDRWYKEFVSDGKLGLTMSTWNKNVSTMEKVITNRYTVVKNNLKREFNLTNDEYNKYFGDL